nr:MAG TPA: hypothetical protein [Caudoviricetes sp.]
MQRTLTPTSSSMSGRLSLITHLLMFVTSLRLKLNHDNPPLS